ncbi:hypothetical protein IU433_23715 [Nocardia puris]|uniref:Excreted virulence factor EspC (Type VII ESX diderm) n=1 Tax=Nocardia puris TaxID=208602 RepID=A0A366CZL1_9NOCA|nr:hypothetical protein [Nocardia puris]MBF6211974.1 hypothetical protein [Nocardia puris]MBF6367000.1 hypothetical protein [Nocardia puris]MBF6462023.1 hypothetical protein [Nocardia puris]RBO83095.1 hypothetical protein DFR74_11917 [Nocardia puris]
MRPDQARDAGSGLYDAAAAGDFRMPEQTAQRLAAACDALIDGLGALRNSSAGLAHVTGFPELPSGVALTKGFAGKGTQFTEVVADLREAALRYKAGFLAAGRLVAEADAANRAALDLAADRLDGGA